MESLGLTLLIIGMLIFTAMPFVIFKVVSALMIIIGYNMVKYSPSKGVRHG